MAWSYCEDLEGSCATCGGVAGECKVVSTVEQRNSCAKEFTFRNGMQASIRDYSVSALDNVVKVAYTTVHIYDAYDGMKYAPPPLPSNYGSSEPVTPFTEYIDRALLGGVPQEHTAGPFAEPHEVHSQSPTDQDAPRSQSTTDPAYISSYRMSAEPLSDWVAGYVWRVCTGGLGLSNRLAQHGAMVFSSNPPTRLSQMIRNLLWSTLLQPSGVFLAIWYISRLPVHLDWLVLDGSVTSQEYDFRVELLDGTRKAQNCSGGDGDSLEAQIVFRLVLLGCMLANKWLDDHTFSNKTWHSITEVPIESINRLELLALALLKHDLSITQSDWHDWLSRLRQYEVAKSPFPSPICRPSAAEHDSVVRIAVDDLLKLTHKGSLKTPTPLPCFCGLFGGSSRSPDGHQPAMDVFEVDLDEDGPLRAEYIPRRISVRGPRLKPSPPSGFVSYNAGLDSPSLPPPATWSPQADPPIQRVAANNRSQVHNHSRKSSFGDSVSLNKPTQWESLTSQIPASGAFDQQARAEDNFSAFNEGYRPPVSHARSTSMMSAFNGPFMAHTRSFSTHALYDFSGAAPLSHSGNVFPGVSNFRHDDPAHFMPMWLRT